MDGPLQAAQGCARRAELASCRVRWGGGGESGSRERRAPQTMCLQAGSAVWPYSVPALPPLTSALSCCLLPFELPNTLVRKASRMPLLWLQGSGVVHGVPLPHSGPEGEPVTWAWALWLSVQLRPMATTLPGPHCPLLKRVGAV